MLTITADELPRVVACNGYLGMPKHQEFAPDDTVKQEGIAAHWLIEQVFKRRFGTDELVDRPAPNGVYITQEMVEYVTPTLELWKGEGEVEVVTSYGDGQTYQVNGRADRIATWGFVPDELYVDDFKFGWGIIEPHMNWTLLSHAFGWLFANPGNTIKKVTLRISQPRPHHPLGKIRSVTYTIEEMWTFWPILQATLTNPTSILITGPQCRKCDANASCPAARKADMNSIDVSELAYVANVDNSGLAFLLDQFERAIATLENSHKALGELALHRIKAGQVVPGRGVEKELTNKQWKKGITVETAMLMTGKNLTKPQLITPGQAVKAGVPQDVVDTLTERVEKGMKLVRISAEAAVKKNFKSII